MIEIHDAYTFILESLFQMSNSRNKKKNYSIFSDDYDSNILDSIGMYNTRICYDPFHLKLNLEIY